MRPDPLVPIVRYVTNPMYCLRDGYNYARHRRALDKSQWLSADEIAEMQLRRLRNLLQFCYERNTFYRERMVGAGLIPSDIRTTGDLALLPLLQKADIRAAGSAMFSTGFTASNSIFTRTGGSTGVPLHVYVDREAMNWKYAATWRHNHWAGWRPGDRVAAIWGDTARAFSIKAWLRNHLQHRMIFLDTLKFSDESCMAFLSDIKSFRPTVLFGHAHSVYRFIRYCETHDFRLPRFSGVVTTAMTLSDHERSTIERVTRSPVFNRYGCEELSVIASESDEHNGLHVFSEGLIVEQLPTDIPNEKELVITDLFNQAMPMIRYAIGDVARLDPRAGPSERGLSRLQRVSGRTADFLYRPDGSSVFGISLLDTYIIHIAGITQAQLVQNQLSTIEVRIVPSPHFSDATVESIRDIVKNEFGPGVQALVTCVEKLEQTERGKYRFSVCNIRRPDLQSGATLQEQ